MSREEFERLVDAAADVAVVVDVPVRPVLDTSFKATSYYQIDGTGLWSGAATSDGVALTRFLYGDGRFFSWADWHALCATGRIRQIG